RMNIGTARIAKSNTPEAVCWAARPAVAVSSMMMYAIDGMSSAIQTGTRSASSTSSAANMISRTIVSQSFHRGGLRDRFRALFWMPQIHHDVERGVPEDHQVAEQHRSVQDGGRQGGRGHRQGAGEQHQGAGRDDHVQGPRRDD